jgi:hypothetical protein
MNEFLYLFSNINDFFITYEIIFIMSMDILYYSNYCIHSKKVLQYLAKEGLTNQFNCICIDHRVRDPKTSQIYIVLENGKQIMMPPNVHSVPAMLLVKQNFRVILGEEIIQYLQPKVKQNNAIATQHQGEPLGFVLNQSNNGMSIVSEQYTYYNMTPEELSAKGKGANRQMYNYVSAADETYSIPTPPDNYRPDKVSGDVTLDSLQQKRNEDINKFFPNNSPFIPSM